MSNFSSCVALTSYTTYLSCLAPSGLIDVVASQYPCNGGVWGWASGDLGDIEILHWYE